jgi:pyruvate kinase
MINPSTEIGLLPSRQESTDISCAVLEGIDCFILTHETSIGKNASAATVHLAKAISEAENVFDHDAAYKTMRDIAIE